MLHTKEAPCCANITVEVWVQILGLQRLTFGVDDVEIAHNFLRDWNLKCISSTDKHSLFVTQEGAEVEICVSGAQELSGAVHADCSLREIVWAVADAASLSAIEASLGRICDVVRRGDVLRAYDPTGFSVAFTLSRLANLAPATPSVNVPGRPVRINQPVDFNERPAVRHLGHVAIFVDDLDLAASFYIDGLGFRASDIYPGRGIFLRAAGSHDHHNIFLLKRSGPAGFHHMSFEVADFQEVITAGRNMRKSGWRTQVGPGRHTLGSNYFWYFHTPMGGACEYYSDMDYLDDDWKVRSWTYSPDVVAAWSTQMIEEHLTT